MKRSRYLWVILLVAAIGGCSGVTSVGVEAGKCFAGQLTPPSLVPSTPMPAPTGQFTFSAPAGSKFALCAW